jgi:exopolysaccharide biosynthesis polyprenyl glycosylphosphotransferase
MTQSMDTSTTGVRPTDAPAVGSTRPQIPAQRKTRGLSKGLGPSTTKDTYNSLLVSHQRRLIAGDVVASVAVTFAAATMRYMDDGIHHLSLSSRTTQLVVLLPIIWLLALASTNAWEKTSLEHASEPYRRVLSAGARAFAGIAILSYSARDDLSRFFVFGTFIVGTTLLLLSRALLKARFRFLLRQTGLSKRFLVVASPTQHEEFIAEMSRAVPAGVAAHFIEPPADFADDGGWFARVSEAYSGGAFDGIVIARSAVRDPALLRRVAHMVDDNHGDLLLISPLASLVPRMQVVDTSGWVRVSEPHIRGSHAILKRAMDLTFVIPAIAILAIPMLLIGLVVKATSRGPVLYVDQRIGAAGRLFTFPKFRTMVDGADQMRLEILGRPDDTMHDRYKADPRITPIGRLLRRWSIDELPQMWCVLVGTMSLVGPRPILREELPQLLPEDDRRHLTKPGLTGPWQVSGRKETSWRERMDHDLGYVEQWNLTTDVVLIAKTVSAIIQGRGAS